MAPQFRVRMPDAYKLDLPPVLLWDPRPPDLLDFAVLQPGPGDLEAPSELKLPDVQPQLQSPNQMPRIDDLRLADQSFPLDNPALPVPSGDVVPLAGREQRDSAIFQAPSLRGGKGNDSLIVLSQNPDIERSSFLLRPMLRLGSIDSEPGEMSEGVVGGTGSPDSSGRRRPSPGGAIQSDTAVSGGGAEGPAKVIKIYRGGQGSGSVQVVEVEPGYGRGVLAGSSAPGGTGDGAATSEGAVLGQPDGASSGSGRLRPLPRARYGIILVSNARSALPEAAGVLSGNPVYTVYLNVPKARHKWVLQYCLPAQQSPRAEIADGVVQVQTRKRIDPPFPIQQEPIALAPPRDGVGETPKRVVVYATFDVLGKLANLRMVRGSDPSTDRTILEALLSWEFLPAFQEGNAVPVEVLFGIPLS
jgi:hypothetical protein